MITPRGADLFLAISGDCDLVVPGVGATPIRATAAAVHCAASGEPIG